MSDLETYINAVGIISPQHTLDNSEFLQESAISEDEVKYCIEPNYKDRIKGGYIRRMSRLIKMGVFAASICLEEAGIEATDAIITGTGLGCQADTEKFMVRIFESDEGLVTPTQFIQSTHNTISAQIALKLKCDSYNFTYVHRGASFETALLDGLLLLKEGNAKNALIGGLDEITETYLNITRRLRKWQRDPLTMDALLNSTCVKSVPGEGAAFFFISNTPTEKSYAKLKGLKMLYKPSDPHIIEKEIVGFLNQYDLSIEDVDVIVSGKSGSETSNEVFDNLESGLFKDSYSVYFKHLCGEYKTASSFAFWMTCQILKTQKIPAAIQTVPFEEKPIRNILIYNNYENINHSILLVQNA